MLEEKIDDIRRLDEITRILAKQEAGFILDYLNLEKRLPFHERIGLERQKKPSPERLREAIEELGPTFVKFGQILAHRPDLVPIEYTKELEKLEDSVPSFSPDKALQIIDEEIGTENFQHIQKEPMAAASISQVHKAKLETGEEVIIKVRRPGIKETIRTDLEIIEILAKQLEKRFKKAKQAQIQKVVQEFSNWTKDELDFEKEQKNADLFRENLSDEEKIRAPKTYPDLTTEKVLVMERVKGYKCTNQEEIKNLDTDNEEVARTIIRGVLKQSIRDGFFHADPHSSNFLIEEDGTIVYLDFGMMGKITKRNRNLLGLLLLHSVNEDAESGVETVKKMAYVEEDANLEALKQEIENKMARINHSTLKETQISKEILDLAVVASQQGVHMPSSMTLMGKSLLTMEGIGLTVYPEFELGEEYKELTEELLIETNKPENMFKELAIDLIQNQDLLTKLPTKLNNKLEPSKQEIKIVEEPEYQFNGRHVIAATLLLSATIFTLNSTTPQTQTYLAGIALVLSIYLLAR